MVEIVWSDTMMPNSDRTIYNALDAAVTNEILEPLLQQLDQTTATAYSRSLRMQPLALYMMQKGTLVDPAARTEAITAGEATIRRLTLALNRLSNALWGAELNPASPKQLSTFFYKFLRLPPIYETRKTKQGKMSTLSCNREALERLALYRPATIFCNLILAIRDEAKIVATLRSGLDPDGRMRCSYNIAGTETGRWSSSKSAFRRGTNKQNWNDELRRIFVADLKKRFVNVDLEQAESRGVAALSRDVAYREACSSGDLHTFVCRMIWPELPWNGDIKRDREIAERPFYRHFSYRDISKRAGHGTNYWGTAVGLAQRIHTTIKLMEEFQEKYFDSFPGIREWQRSTIRELQLTGQLTTPLGRRRCFFGRRLSDDTAREAIAFQPQSLIVDALNEGVLQAWKQYPMMEPLEQGHDSVLFQLPEPHIHLAPEIAQAMIYPIEFPDGYILRIPTEWSTGWTWRKWCKEEPDGLKKYSLDRSRTRFPSHNLQSFLSRHA